MLVAPNAFKGSLSCSDAAKAMARGVRAAFKDAQVTAIPVADGGDGLIDALRLSQGGKLVSASVRGPLGERRRAHYLWIPGDKLAVIEMARASGLALVPPGRRRPLEATSRGTGDLMRDAIRRGARTLIVGLGGTASSDGGAGMARALGARLLDAEGRELPDGTAALARLAKVDARPVRALLDGISVIALTDVTNPLLGPRGSARTFGPQKGATAAQVRLIESALAVWAVAMHRDLGICVAAVPGAGAAGGLGAGLLAFARAKLVPGADWIIDKTGAGRALKSADLVITGEGRLDRTSLFGKAPVALARRARRCAAVCGQKDVASLRSLRAAGFARIVSFSDAGAKSTEDSMKNAARWAEKAAKLAVTGLTALMLVSGLSLFVSAAEPMKPEYGDDLYFHRDQGDNLRDVVEKLQVKSANGDPEALWRLCRAKVRQAEAKRLKSEKLAGYDSAKADCEKAVALLPNTADAHFWLGVALGRWAETKGMMKALFAIKPIKREMAETIRLDPQHGGAHNVLGEILWQVPGFAGGDKKKALEEFETALRLSPRYTANYQPLAEAYLRFNRKDDAIKVLKAVEEVKDPADPAEYPDNLKDAKALLEKLEGSR